MKEMLIEACQDFINSYYGTHGKVDTSYYDMTKDFRFGIDEGFFGYKYKNDEIDIVIQGTDEELEWHGSKSSNFNFIAKQTDKHFGENTDIKVHEGFFLAYKTGREMLLSEAQKFKNIIVKGHSRGGALSTLCARDIKWHIDNVWNTKHEVTLITGGSPRVYNYAGANEFDKCGIESYRLVYRNDTVSRVPYNIFGYKHIGKLIWLGKPFILSPIGIPFDHEPEKYLEGIKKYKID